VGLDAVVTSNDEVVAVSTSVDEDVSDVVVLGSFVISGAEVVVVSASVDEDDSDVVGLDVVIEKLMEDETTPVVSEIVPDERGDEEKDEEDEEDEVVEVVTGADELVEVDTVLIDGVMTDDTMVALVLLRLEVGGTTGVLELDIVVLTSELVTMAEELVAEGMVLEVDTEVVEEVTGRITLELDALLKLELELVEIIDEFEIGYRTLERLLELEIRLVTILCGPVETPGLVAEDGLVDTEGTVGVESCVGGDAVVAAEEDADADGLANAEELPGGTDTDGLNTTVAKMRPEACLRLDRSNWFKRLHEGAFSSKEAATQFSWAEHLARHPSRDAGAPADPMAWRLRRLLMTIPL
jgi:hypothetical protein